MCVLSYYLQTWGQLHQNVIYYYCYYFKITSITIIGTMLDQCNLLYYYYLLILLLCYSIEPQHEQQLPLQPGKITVLISLNLSSLLISHLSLVPHLYHCFNHVALTLFLISYSIDPSIHDSSASPSTPRRAPPAVPPTPTKEGAADDDSSNEEKERISGVAVTLITPLLRHTDDEEESEDKPFPISESEFMCIHCMLLVRLCELLLKPLHS